MDQFATLVRAFAQEAGLAVDWEPVSPIEFTIDDLPVVISLDRRTGMDDIVIYSRLGTVPEARELEVYRILLEANVMWSATGDATLAVNSATREALLCYRYPMKDLAGPAFVSLVAAFVELAENWRDVIAAAEDEIAAPAGGIPLTAIRG